MPCCPGGGRCSATLRPSTSLWAGIERWQAQGSRLGKTYFVGLAGHAQAVGGDLVAAAVTLDGALGLVDSMDEHFWEPELLRLRAEVLRAGGGDPSQVDELLERARQCAVSQRAVALAVHVEASRSRPGPEFVQRA